MANNRVTIDDLMSSNYPEPTWLVPGKISTGLTNVGSRPKVGKSILCLQLAIAKATGGSFLGEELEKGRVLYIDYENFELRTQKRIKKMGVPKDAELEFHFSWPRLDEGGCDELEKEIENRKCDLIIIDTLSRALTNKADQLDMAQMSDLVGRLQNLAISHNMSIIIIDHHRKETGSPDELVDAIWGSTGKAAPLDTVLGLIKKGDKVILKIVGRDIEEQEYTLILNKGTLTWSIGDVAKSQDHSRKERVYKASIELLEKGILPTTTNIANYLVLDKGNVSSDIKELVAEGRLIPGEKQGRDQPYYPPDRLPPKAMTKE